MPQQGPSNLLVGLGAGLSGLSEMIMGLSARNKAEALQRAALDRQNRLDTQTQSNWQEKFALDKQNQSADQLLQQAQMDRLLTRDKAADRENYLGRASDTLKSYKPGQTIDPSIATGIQGSGLEGLLTETKNPLKSQGPQALVPGGPALEAFALPDTPITSVRRETSADAVAEVDRLLREHQLKAGQSSLTQSESNFKAKQDLAARLRQPGYQMTPEDMMLSGLRGEDLLSPDQADRRTINRSAAIADAQAAAQARHRPTTMTPTSESELIMKLSRDWNAANKVSRELDRSIGLMDAGIKAAERGDMAQGAQAVLVTFQKILDPTSVVRESEYERSGTGQSVRNRVQGYFEQLSKGGAGVPLTELRKFVQLAREASAAQKQALPADQTRMKSIAARYGIPEELIFNQVAEEATRPGAAGGGVPPTVSSLLQGQKDGVYPLSDGSKWQVQGGVITRVQ